MCPSPHGVQGSPMEHSRGWDVWTLSSRGDLSRKNLKWGEGLAIYWSDSETAPPSPLGLGFTLEGALLHLSLALPRLCGQGKSHLAFVAAGSTLMIKFPQTASLGCLV